MTKEVTLTFALLICLNVVYFNHYN